jgi:DNA-binding transcriptional MerR regulator
LSEHLPGTTLPFTTQDKADAFSALDPIFAVSPGGLLLSQITELTGLGASTVQNWVKRGWVSRPEHKKYGELQVARILLINLLRPAMQLEEIVTLLRYINGSVDDRTDDIIPETRLYSLLCSAIFELEVGRNLSSGAISALVDALLCDYQGPVPDASQRLNTALNVMLLNVAASKLMQRAAGIYEDCITVKSEGCAADS